MIRRIFAGVLVLAGMAWADDSFAPAFFWWWNSKLDAAALCRQVDAFHDLGARTLCIHPFPQAFRPGRFPSDMAPDYLTDDYLRIYRAVTDHAAAKGMTCWLYDEGGWPSGGACGQVLARDPERFAQRWMTLDKAGNPKILRLPPRPDLMAPYPSVLEPGSTETFLALTHAKLAPCVGHHFGQAVPWVFTDEPCAPNGHVGIPWCSDFAAFFRAQKGYDLMPHVPALARTWKKMPVPEDLKRVRIDYFDVMSRLFLERCLEPNRAWCRAHRLQYGGHFDGDDDPLCNLTHGHFHLLRALRALDLPGVDAIWRQIHPATPYTAFPRYASSAAHQTGAQRVLGEVFCIYGESLSPEVMKYVVDFEMVRGVNQFVFAYALQSTKRNFRAVGEPHFGAPDPKTPFLRPFMDYVRDTCARLAAGTNPVQVAVYYDAKSIWAGGGDPRGEGVAAARAQLQVAQDLDARQVDFDFVDDDLIEAGRLPYAAVVLPTRKWLSPRAEAALAAFRARGGRVVSPAEVASVPRTCRATGPGAAKLRVTKRVLPDGAADYFLVNEGAQTIAPEVTFDEGATRVCTLDPYGSAFIRIARDGTVSAPPSRPALLAQRTLSADWTVRKTWAVIAGQDDFAYPDCTQETAQPCRLGDWRALFGTNFSGRAVYRTAFTAAGGEAELDLGRVGVCAAARLNGRDLAPRFAPPFRWRVPLVAGTNVLEVTVGNTLANAMIPELDRLGREYPPKTVYAPRELAFYAQDDLASGLMGPVTLGIVSAQESRKPGP